MSADIGVGRSDPRINTHSERHLRTEDAGRQLVGPLSGPLRSTCLLLAVLPLLGIGCDQARSTDSPESCDPSPVPPARGTFADAFLERDSFRLLSSGANPVMGVRTLDVSHPERHLLLVDSRSNDLKVADSDGQVRRTIGRYGQGPGEFTSLYDAVFLPDGRILALDAGNSRASLFEITGEFVTDFVIRGQDPRAVVATRSSTVVIGGLLAPRRGHQNVAATYALDGSREAAFLPADSLVLRTNLVMDQVWLATLPGDLLAISLGLTPELHLFSTSGVHICTQTTELPGWSQLLPPEQPVTGLPAARAWIDSATFAGVMAFVGGRLYRQYGSSGNGGPELLAEYDVGLRLLAVYDSLPGDLVGSDTESLIFAGEETIDDIPIYMYVPRVEEGS